ncbi:MAG: hypothetical protein PUG09_05220 [Prevotella sp.]|nr:hypothetical protein [Prevotella sp.]
MKMHYTTPKSSCLTCEGEHLLAGGDSSTPSAYQGRHVYLNLDDNARILDDGEMGDAGEGRAKSDTYGLWDEE